jgi:hypothetical protein
MRVLRTGLLMVALVVAPAGAMPTVLAAPPPPTSHVAAQRSARALIAANDSQFFSGQGAAFYTSTSRVAAIRLTFSLCTTRSMIPLPRENVFSARTLTACRRRSTYR